MPATGAFATLTRSRQRASPLRPPPPRQRYPQRRTAQHANRLLGAVAHDPSSEHACAACCARLLIGVSRPLTAFTFQTNVSVLPLGGWPSISTRYTLGSVV